MSAEQVGTGYFAVRRPGAPFAAALLALTAVASAHAAIPAVDTSRLADGDVIFHTSRSGQSEAIQLATDSPWSHMGLLFERADGWYVLEAIATVRYTPLDAWVRRGEGGRYVVKRLADTDRLRSAATVAALRRAGESYLGKPYDLRFAWGDDAIYCSELVFKAYREALGVELGTLARFGDFDLSAPAVRAKLAERFGGRIPLDEPVIAPSAIFAASQLVTVEEH